MSALDRLPPSLLITSRSRVLPPPAALTPKALYGRGPGTLRHTAIKRLVLAASALLVLYALTTTALLCWYRSFCFAEEASGSGGAGHFTYSGSASRAVVPVAFSAVFLVAPANVAAARLQLPWLVLTAWVLAGLLCAFFSVAAVATLALLGNGGVAKAAAAAWAATPTLAREVLHPGGEAAVEQGMRGDAAAVGIAALAGGVIAGLLALAVFPLGKVVFWAVVTPLRGWWAARLRRSGAGGGGPAAEGAASSELAQLDLRALCCTLGPAALEHDAAALAPDEGVVLACGMFRVTLCAPRGAAAAGAAGGAGAGAGAWLWASPFCGLCRCLAGTPANAATAAALDVAGGCCGAWTRALVACCLLGRPRRGLLPAGAAPISPATGGGGGGAPAQPPVAGGGGGAPNP